MANENKFEVRGNLTVRKSATVLCIRRNKNITNTSCESFGEKFLRKHNIQENAFLQKYFKDCENFHFQSGWEVLLGQSEVINYLKSTEEKLVLMRYFGEYKLAGGNVDKGESIEECAKRELDEEFLRPAETQVPSDEIILRPFSVKQTRPIRSRSNLMYNFVALAEENPWLDNLDIDTINQALKDRKKEFIAFVKFPDSPYWNYPTKQKELISPEVHELRWVPLEKAMEFCLSSLIKESYVNEWQRQEMMGFNKKIRDPMVMTGATLVELEMFSNCQALLNHCQSVSLEGLAKEEQWLFDGMSDQQVRDAFQNRLGKNNSLNPSFKPMSMIKQKRNLLLKQTSKL